jgi:hypothetical protein
LYFFKKIYRKIIINITLTLREYQQLKDLISETEQIREQKELKLEDNITYGEILSDVINILEPKLTE